MKQLLVFFLMTLGTLAADSEPPKKTVLILGDSITEGYGVEKEKSFPALLERLLHKQGKTEIRVFMAGIGGATTASGVQRLKYHFKENPDILVLALGANDGLRGLKVAETKKNLKETLRLAKTKGLKILLAGMKVPPNYGKNYAQEFTKMFEILAREEKIALMPFLLEGVGGEQELNQEDGIHPNEKGHALIAKNLLQHLEKLF
ncbi:MAG: arylesterase [Pseudomonadota bacterium]|nr:arylesterase [Pseudomonadota bacterium]